jgi:thioredoxin 1
MDTGFMGTVKLIAADAARIDYVYTTQDFAKDWSSVAVTVTVEAMSPAGGETTFAATLGDVAKSEKVTLKPGANKVSLTLDVKNPKLWWPAGYGAQPLYPLSVTLGDAKAEKKVGLRKAEVYNEEDAEPDPATGKKGKPMVVDFWATWCGPCKKIGPYIEELAENYGDRAIIGKVDVDENDELAIRYGVRNIPTVLFLRNGEIVDKQIGAAPKAVFEAKLQSILK